MAQNSLAEIATVDASLFQEKLLSRQNEASKSSIAVRMPLHDSWALPNFNSQNFGIATYQTLAFANTCVASGNRASFHSLSLTPLARWCRNLGKRLIQNRSPSFSANINSPACSPHFGHANVRFSFLGRVALICCPISFAARSHRSFTVITSAWFDSSTAALPGLSPNAWSCCLVSASRVISLVAAQAPKI